MGTDLDQLDQEQRESWRRAAQGWEKWQAQLREASSPVSGWMIDAISPEPGQRILELAAGPGETGFLAAQQIGPSGTLISSDQSEEMVAVARRRAAQLGLENVEFRVFDAEQLALEAASVDAVLCRWGFMLMGNPAAALSHARRVLRSPGRFAMAAWDTPDRNLWMAAPVMQLVARGAFPMPEPGAPTPFSMADPEKLAGQLEAAGFTEIETGKVEFALSHPSFEMFWETTTDLAAPIANAIREMDAEQASELRDGVRGALHQFAAADGSLVVPASAIVAAASA